MRRIAVVFASAFIAVLMTGSPVSAESFTEFTDREGDLSPCPMYDLLNGNGDGLSEEGHHICDADYLDLASGRVTLHDDGTYSLELQMVGDVNYDTVLPDGIKGVLWVWYFYEDNTDFYNDACMAVVSYDGESFEAYMKYREVFLELPYDYWYLDFAPCEEDYTKVCLEIDDDKSLDLISSMNWWFGETKAWFSTLIEPWEEWAWQPTFGGWVCVDANDAYPEETPIPLLIEMPV